MKLYYSPGVCSLAPHIALKEAGIEAELVKVDMATHTLPDGADFYDINPRGYVPVLEMDNGERMSEGPAIMQYLADLRPQARLAPAAGSWERYRLQEWLAFINSELHKGFGPLFDPDLGDEAKALLRGKVEKRLDWLAGRIAGTTWLLGDQFTVADGYLFTVLGWTRFLGIDLAKWPELDAYRDRVGARPAVRAAMRAEGLAR